VYITIRLPAFSPETSIGSYITTRWKALCAKETCVGQRLPALNAVCDHQTSECQQAGSNPNGHKTSVLTRVGPLLLGRLSVLMASSRMVCDSVAQQRR